MCEMTGFDVCYESGDRCTITPHFCRCVGCGGMSYDEACDMVEEHYEGLAKEWRDRTAYLARYYSHSDEVGQDGS